MLCDGLNGKAEVRHRAAGVASAKAVFASQTFENGLVQTDLRVLSAPCALVEPADFLDSLMAGSLLSSLLVGTNVLGTCRSPDQSGALATPEIATTFLRGTAS